ncbi:unnamed protein product [Arabis nemorensis]|uniref:DNA topoisomerase (ATP-hydrolyzing) n=1 Tax=Arabis nemorensis TaxID=586526 RepID=A0A565CCL8_9BRAS|nr:unnamed protein product [Arabis nemorensis]
MASNLPLQSSNNVNVAKAKVPAKAPASRAEKTIEEMYQKKSQLEHILLRPNTYIGSVEKHTQTLWVYENDEMVYRPVTYVLGFLLSIHHRDCRWQATEEIQAGTSIASAA